MAKKTTLPYKTEWNFKLYYKGQNDPKIERDVKTIEREFSVFEKKYRNRDFTKSPETLAKAFSDKNKLSKKLSKIDPGFYFSRAIDIDSENEKALARSTQINERLTHASNKLKFFRLRISSIPKEKHLKFLRSPILKPYSYTLENVFKFAKYNLTEKEEQLVSLLSQTSYSMWVDSQEKLLNKQMVKHGKKMIPIAKAMGIIPELGRKERHALFKEVMLTQKSISHVAEAELNAIVNYKKIMDEKRGFKKPYSSTLLSNENEEKEIESLVSIITKKFSIGHRFYRLHAKLLGKKKIVYADKSVPIGKIKKKFDFKITASIVREALESVNPAYASIFDKYLINGQIDVYPRKGKAGGGYCAGADDLPTFILLNHTDDLRSVETLGHEMGHAIHGELANTQPYRYRGSTTSTAEVASTFFEQVTQSIIEKQLTDKEKIIFLHNKIMGDIGTIFRQIALFNFENELHLRIRKEGQLSAKQISSLLAKHMRTYLGTTVEMKDEEGYGFVSWSHIRYFFYVYSYAYGQIISKALFKMWSRDKNTALKIEKFLKAGSSMSPTDIFKSIGIDVSNPKFFEAGLKSIEKDITKLEELTRKRRE